MTSASRRAVGLLLSGLAALSSGCQRGCLREKVEQAVDRKHGIAAPLAQVDCPDELARCVEGVVQSSRAYSYSVPCSASPEACTCPWTEVTACARGCAAESVVLPLPARLAADQLCAPSGTVALPAAPPLLAPTTPPPPSSSAAIPWTAPSDPTTCEGERFRCTGGRVVACEPSAHDLARCLFGCAVDDATLEEEQVTDRQATDVLCRHAAPDSVAPVSKDSGIAR